jgi:hypothetical protein
MTSKNANRDTIVIERDHEYKDLMILYTTHSLRKSQDSSDVSKIYTRRYWVFGVDFDYLSTHELGFTIYHAVLTTISSLSWIDNPLKHYQALLSSFVNCLFLNKEFKSTRKRKHSSSSDDDEDNDEDNDEENDKDNDEDNDKDNDDEGDDKGNDEGNDDPDNNFKKKNDSKSKQRKRKIPIARTVTDRKLKTATTPNKINSDNKSENEPKPSQKGDETLYKSQLIKQSQNIAEERRKAKRRYQNHITAKESNNPYYIEYVDFFGFMFACSPASLLRFSNILLLGIAKKQRVIIPTTINKSQIRE